MLLISDPRIDWSSLSILLIAITGLVYSQKRRTIMIRSLHMVIVPIFRILSFALRSVWWWDQRSLAFLENHAISLPILLYTLFYHNIIFDEVFSIQINVEYQVRQCNVSCICSNRPTRLMTNSFLRQKPPQDLNSPRLYPSPLTFLLELESWNRHRWSKALSRPRLWSHESIDAWYQSNSRFAIKIEARHTFDFIIILHLMLPIHARVLSLVVCYPESSVLPLAIKCIRAWVVGWKLSTCEVEMK